MLFRSILKNGCCSPIIVNEDMAIIDGHNRQRLCEQHGLLCYTHFQTVIIFSAFVILGLSTYLQVCYYLRSRFLGNNSFAQF